MQGRPHLVPYRPVDGTEHPRSCGHCTQADAPLYHNANMEFSVLIGQRSCCLVTTHTTVPERSTMGSNVTAKGLSRIPRQSTKSLAARLLHPAGKQSSWQSRALVPRTSSSLRRSTTRSPTPPSRIWSASSTTPIPEESRPSRHRYHSPIGHRTPGPPTRCQLSTGIRSIEYGLIPVAHNPPCGMPSYGLLPVEYQPSAPSIT